MPRPKASMRAAAPIGLFGPWTQSGPGAHADTLVLLPDSVAHGWDREPGTRAMAVNRWKIQYRSKDPAESRRDRLGMTYQDGGDLHCTVTQDSPCVSLPVFCLGDAAGYDCMGFRYHGDSLALSNGARYRRVLAPRSSE
ncbi:MAG: hypothetical protein ACREN6_05010 [Gemmatimonadaceae bacterium]